MEMSMPFAYGSSIGALSSKFSTSSISATGDERRRDVNGHGNGNGNGNGTKTRNPSETIPHNPSHPHYPPPPQHNPDPDPCQDPVPATIAVTAPTTSIPISGRSNSKTRPSKHVVSVKYKECLKNYAANVGGHVVDGCGEYMPSGDESFKCAACDCHRNFHRKELDGIPNPKPLLLLSPPPVHQKHPLGQPTSPPPSGRIIQPQPTMMAFGSGAESSSEDRDMLPAPPLYPQVKKRFRTKFSREQKEKMWEFAEKSGWRIQKQEEQVFQQFCDEVGVKRNVLKVWMHNNKQSMKRKNLQEDMQL